MGPPRPPAAQRAASTAVAIAAYPASFAWMSLREHIHVQSQMRLTLVGTGDPDPSVVANAPATSATFALAAVAALVISALRPARRGCDCAAAARPSGPGVGGQQRVVVGQHDDRHRRRHRADLPEDARQLLGHRRGRARRARLVDRRPRAPQDVVRPHVQGDQAGGRRVGLEERHRRRQLAALGVGAEAALQHRGRRLTGAPQVAQLGARLPLADAVEHRPRIPVFLVVAGRRLQAGRERVAQGDVPAARGRGGGAGRRRRARGDGHRRRGRRDRRDDALRSGRLGDRARASGHAQNDRCSRHDSGETSTHRPSVPWRRYPDVPLSRSGRDGAAEPQPNIRHLAQTAPRIARKVFASRGSGGRGRTQPSRLPHADGGAGRADRARPAYARRPARGAERGRRGPVDPGRHRPPGTGDRRAATGA